MKVIQLLVFSFLTAASTFIFAQQQTLSLNEAIELGLANQYQIQIDQKRIEQAANQDTWAFAGKLPTVNLNINQNNSLSQNQSPNPFALNGAILNNDLRANVDARWLLFNGSRINMTKDQLSAQVESQKALSEVTIQSTIKNIIDQYYLTLLRQSQLRTLKELVVLSRDQVERQNVRISLGQGGKFNKLQAQDAYYVDSTNLLLQQTVLENQFHQLNLAMGVDALQQTYVLSDTLTQVTLDESFESLLQQTLDDNANIKALKQNKELASIVTEIQQTAYMPSVFVNAGVNSSLSFLTPVSEAIQEAVGRGAQAGNNITPYVNFTATYTLFDGGVRNINVQNARLNETIADLQIKDSERTLKVTLQNLLTTFRNQERLVDISKAQVANARENLDIATERFNAAQLTSFEYRAVQLAYLSADQAALLAIYNLKTTETALLQLTGNIVP